MKTKQKGVCSLKGVSEKGSKFIIFNYAVWSLGDMETRELNQILNFRRMELWEKLDWMLKKIDEVVNPGLFSTKDEDYIMNKLIGIQKFIIDDSPIVLPIFTMKELWKQWD